MKAIIVFCLIFLPVITQVATSNVEALFVTINQRLAYMEDVALYKATHQLAIENRDREQQVLQVAKSQAVAQGLNPASIEAFFKAQIAAAKAIQYRYRADLLSQDNKRSAKDLNKEVRPKLIELGQQIIGQINDYIEVHERFRSSQRALFFATVDQRYLSDGDKTRLFDGLLNIH